MQKPSLRKRSKRISYAEDEDDNSFGEEEIVEEHFDDDDVEEEEIKRRPTRSSSRKQTTSTEKSTPRKKRQQQEDEDHDDDYVEMDDISENNDETPRMSSTRKNSRNAHRTSNGSKAKSSPSTGGKRMTTNNNTKTSAATSHTKTSTTSPSTHKTTSPTRNATRSNKQVASSSPSSNASSKHTAEGTHQIKNQDSTCEEQQDEDNNNDENAILFISSSSSSEDSEDEYINPSGSDDEGLEELSHWVDIDESEDLVVTMSDDEDEQDDSAEEDDDESSDDQDDEDYRESKRKKPQKSRKSTSTLTKRNNVTKRRREKSISPLPVSRNSKTGSNTNQRRKKSPATKLPSPASRGGRSRKSPATRQESPSTSLDTKNGVPNLYQIYNVSEVQEQLQEYNRSRIAEMNHESDHEEHTLQNKQLGKSQFTNLSIQHPVQKNSTLPPNVTVHTNISNDTIKNPSPNRDTCSNQQVSLVTPYSKSKCEFFKLPQTTSLANEENDLHMNENINMAPSIGVKLANFDGFQSLIEKKLLLKNASLDEENDENQEDDQPYDPSFISEHVSNAVAVGASSHYTIKPFKDGHYINCDLRYFTLSSLGKFDVILIDPPWRVVQSRPQEAMMFSNTNFKLNYNTLSYQEIMDINVGSLCDQGFCFLWVLNSSLQFGLNLLNHWGFTYIDKIVWVKKTKNDQIFAGTGYYFLHSTELLLVGVKHGSTKKNGQKLQYISKVSNDILFSKVGIQSQKPKEVYEIIENMVPGARKIELFGRNHNIRRGWLSVGNRLGEAFEKEMTSYSCTKCDKNLFSPDMMGTSKNIPRYKSHVDPTVNLCSQCADKYEKQYGPYFVIENTCTEPIFHDWYACDNCEMYPICGSRFSCKECDKDFDVCEECFDATMTSTPEEGGHQHAASAFTCIEFPDPGCGYAVHVDKRCTSCLACPIVGERFMCTECKDVNLCRKCFFLQKEPKGHKCTHEISLIPEPRHVHSKLKCAACATVGLEGPIHKCKTCMSFILCNKCYILHEKNYESLHLDKYTTHKPFHSFMRMK
ncbi:hypothetical protein C9374_011485 [Naegleria lovaniensis]|uniref:ZZ-type domain-containing protein n=1 Tax=Naegleria lovaniensis TaxID=51637 RepID=A0AA88H0S0_NAELO|nr:uncharacterized protein C9374_011485 [Naegleria lovaniensis]KAG2392760.1 hypothetical protein C9374_011485 [Naegleria lovaniensis]